MTPTLDVAGLGRRAQAMLDELAAISETPEGLTRRYLTPEFMRAAHLVGLWMAEAGLTVAIDALGTVRGRKGPARRLILGSHIDTVVNAGLYDGMAGVVAAILAVDELGQRGVDLPIGLEVVAFGDEEGSRFPTVLSSSAALAGHFDPTWLDAADNDGITFRGALFACGLDPAGIADARVPPGEAIGYVELHIEQGPVLEHGGHALGIVTGIAGQTRARLTINGLAGHAGTVPMALRQDALAAAADIVHAIERIGRAAGHGLVATVGRFDVHPGASNVIADRVTFTLDLRAPDDADRRRAFATINAHAEKAAAERRCGVIIDVYHDVPSAPCSTDLQDRLGAAIESLGLAAPRLPSGAGHDGQAMARLCPYGMIFVRCRGGISHNPLEFAESDDLGLGVAALIRFLEAYRA